MKTIRVKPVEMIGTCPARIMPKDEFQIEEMNLIHTGNVNLCFLAISHFPPTIWQLQNESRFFGHVSCPGCTKQPDEENRVVFLLGHADKWDLCQAISEYRRLTCQHSEPEKAKKLRVEAMQAQTDGDFSRATLVMKAALNTFKGVK